MHLTLEVSFHGPVSTQAPRQTRAQETMSGCSVTESRDPGDQARGGFHKAFGFWVGDGGVLWVERYCGDPLKEFSCVCVFGSLFAQALIGNIITFYLIIYLNELYFYLSRSLAGPRQLWQLSERENSY